MTHQGPLIELSLGSIVLKRPTVVTISGPLSLGGRAHDQIFRKKKKVSGYVAIGTRIMCVKFRGYVVWLGCKNWVAIHTEKAVFDRGNYQKRNILQAFHLRDQSKFQNFTLGIGPDHHSH